LTTGLGTIPGDDDVAEIKRIWLSLGAPEAIPFNVIDVGVSSFIVSGPMASSVGVSFTPVIVSKKLLIVVAPSPSVTEIEIVTAPNWFGAGVTVTVRLEPLPPKTMLARGTIVVSEEAAPKTRFALAVSTSPTVKLIAGKAVSSSTKRFVIALIVGRALTCVTALAELFAETGSGLDENAETRFVMLPPVVGEPMIVIAADPPARIVPRLHVTFPALGVQTPMVV